MSFVSCVWEFLCTSTVLRCNSLALLPAFEDLPHLVAPLSTCFPPHLVASLSLTFCGHLWTTLFSCTAPCLCYALLLLLVHCAMLMLCASFIWSFMRSFMWFFMRPAQLISLHRLSLDYFRALRSALDSHMLNMLCNNIYVMSYYVILFM
jgi:hypothetical protein